MSIRKKSDVEKLIDKGAGLKKESLDETKYSYMRLAIPMVLYTKMMDDIRKSGNKKTTWILEAIRERLKNEAI